MQNDDWVACDVANLDNSEVNFKKKIKKETLSKKYDFLKSFHVKFMQLQKTQIIREQCNIFLSIAMWFT